MHGYPWQLACGQLARPASRTNKRPLAWFRCHVNFTYKEPKLGWLAALQPRSPLPLPPASFAREFVKKTRVINRLRLLEIVCKPSHSFAVSFSVRDTRYSLAGWKTATAHSVLLTSRRRARLRAHHLGYRRKLRVPNFQIPICCVQCPSLCSRYSCLDLCHSYPCVCPRHLCGTSH